MAEQGRLMPALRKMNVGTGVRYLIDNHVSAFYL